MAVYMEPLGINTESFSILAPVDSDLDKLGVTLVPRMVPIEVPIHKKFWGGPETTTQETMTSIRPQTLSPECLKGRTIVRAKVHCTLTHPETLNPTP